MFWSRVQERMDEVGIPSIRELEKKAGVSNGTISTRKNQLKMPTVVIAEGLCRALRWTWVELWAQAGYIPLGALDTHITPEEQRLIDHYRSLPPYLRQAALDAIGGMAGRGQPSPPHYEPGEAALIALDPKLFAQGDVRPMTDDQWAATKRYFEHIWDMAPPQLKSWVGYMIAAATERVAGGRREDVLPCEEDAGQSR